MTYIGYCNLLEKEIDADNARVEANREELLNFYGTSKKSVNAFMLGGTFVILFCSMPEQTVDLVKQKTKNILIVAAGGATTKTTSILGQVAPILLSSTPNLLV